MMPHQEKHSRGAVVITGASTGIGKTTALHLYGLGFRVFAGVMPRGFPARAEPTSDGSGRKCARQPGLSWDFCWIMQTVMRSTSGM